MDGMLHSRSYIHTFASWWVFPSEAAFIKLTRFQETRVMMASEMTITQELHILRAHNLHYASLLRDLRKTVEFISTHAHSLPDSIYRPEKYDADKTIPIQAAVRLECVNLLESVERLEMAQKMHDDRLNNVMNLVRLILLPGVNSEMCY